MINATIGTKQKCTCISRPRRFGKSYAAQMLCAYYDLSCDSRQLFEKYEIAADEGFEKNINRYHVISFDVTNFISEARKEGDSLREVPSGISAAIQNDVLKQYADLDPGITLNDSLISLVRKTGRQIVFIIDEWDTMIRESSGDTEAQERYLNILRGWLKITILRPPWWPLPI